MDEKQRLQLQNMIKANNVEDQTQLIRDLKHSHILKNVINSMIMIKAKYRNDPEKINLECMNECGFLFTYYRRWGTRPTFRFFFGRHAVKRVIY